MASLSNFRHNVPGDVPTYDDQQPARSTYMTLMYNRHYTLSTTHTTHKLATGWCTALTPSSPPTTPPPPAQARPRHVHQGGRAGQLPPLGHVGDASPWTRCSSSVAATRALVGRCIALQSGPNGPGGSPRTGGCGRSCCAPSRGRPHRTAGDPTPLCPTTLQLCPYMVAARLMALLWSGPDTPTQSYPHLTEEDIPGIQRCFVSTLDYLQHTHPHVLEQIWTPPV